MRKNSSLMILLLLCLSCSTVLQAQQDGMVDNTFATNGTLTLSVGTNDNLKSIALAPGGKMVLAGSVYSGGDKMYIARITADGLLDPSFNLAGSKIFSDSVNSTYKQYAASASDGGIIFGYGQGSFKKPVVGKLAADGSPISSTGPYSIGPATYGHNIADFSYNRNTGKTSLVGFVSYTDSYMITSTHATSGGLDNTFNGTGKLYLDNTFSSTMKFTSGKAVLSLNDGSVLLGGISSPVAAPAAQPAFTVMKFRQDGTLDNTFGTTGFSRVTLGSTNVSVGAMAIDANGKILVVGSSNSNFSVYRLKSDGSYDSTFNAFIYDYGTADYLNSICIQPDNKILVSGSTSVAGFNYGFVARLHSDGVLDQSFGTMGVVGLPNMSVNASEISVSNRRLLLAGKNTSSGKMTVVALKYQIQKYNIVGKDIVSIESENRFMIHPYSPANTYAWSYSSSDIYTLGAGNKDTVTFYFTRTTPSGTITCTIYSPQGSPTTVTKTIQVNPEPTLAQQLSPVACEPSQTYANNYINSFGIRQTKVASSNTGSSPTGYNDLTAGSYDTLYIGDNYQALVECVRPDNKTLYCGIWIDLDNNGKMENQDEFLGSAVSDNNNFTINNMVIPTDASPGPKRVRIRVRESGPFQATEFCMVNEELSETEDYLVVFGYYQGIKTPNFITPNNDGKNDNFVVRGVKEGLENTLKVFNRVGDLVFDANNYDNSWSGQDKSGGLLKPGTYYFVFTQSAIGNTKDDVVKGFFEIRY